MQYELHLHCRKVAVQISINNNGSEVSIEWGSMSLLGLFRQMHQSDKLQQNQVDHGVLFYQPRKKFSLYSL